jgi:hypothetical protein
LARRSSPQVFVLYIYIIFNIQKASCKFTQFSQHKSEHTKIKKRNGVRPLPDCPSPTQEGDEIERSIEGSKRR